MNEPESRLAARIRLMTPYIALVAAAALAILLVFSLTSCAPPLPPAVSLSLTREKQSPRDAVVVIDEEYIGPLGYVAARGVRLPAGRHRITIEKPGYFPWDRLVDTGKDPIHFDIALEPIPD